MKIFVIVCVLLHSGRGIIHCQADFFAGSCAARQQGISVHVRIIPKSNDLNFENIFLSAADGAKVNLGTRQRSVCKPTENYNHYLLLANWLARRVKRKTRTLQKSYRFFLKAV